MQTVKVNILNPKAAKLLKELEALNLISISDSETVSLAKLLKKLRGKKTSVLSLEDITKEVAIVRKKRYAK